MAALEMLDSWLRKPWLLLVLVTLICLWALHVAIPHVSDEIWQDEAATLLAFSRHGALYSYLHYKAANNHVLFSMLAAFWMQFAPGGVSVAYLRLLPILMFVAATPMCFLAARRMGGIYCGLLASLLFATSGVASEFAAPLRGYGPSWFFVCAMLLCALNVFAADRARTWRFAYLLSTVLLVGMLPSNFYFALSVAVAAGLHHASDARLRVGRSAAGFACLMVAPFAGLLLYVPVWGELLEAARVGASHWSLQDLLANWLQAAGRPLLWLLPFVLVGLAMGGLSTIRALKRRAPMPNMWLLAVLLPVGMVVAVAVMPSVPYPRNLVPYLPIWFCSLSLLAVQGFGELAARSRNLAVAASIFLLAGNLVSAPAPCRSAFEGQKFGYDLCYQYFHDNYHPSQVLDIWAQLEQPDLAIVTDYEGYFSLNVLGSPALVLEYRNIRFGLTKAPLLVAHSAEEMRPMARALQLEPSTYQMIADTGYYKVFAAVRSSP